MAGGGEITDICVIAEKKDICTPCGGCRQRLAEFAPSDAKVHLCTMNGIVETITMADLLPHGFESDALIKAN
jgi:cytidine deaminase